MSHLKDPTTQYYTGEYPKQKQPTPGIQAKMTPVPDCGEKTYVGSGRLKDRKALVTGGDSGIDTGWQQDFLWKKRISQNSGED